MAPLEGHVPDLRGLRGTPRSARVPLVWGGWCATVFESGGPHSRLRAPADRGRAQRTSCWPTCTLSRRRWNTRVSRGRTQLAGPGTPSRGGSRATRACPAGSRWSSRIESLRRTGCRRTGSSGSCGGSGRYGACGVPQPPAVRGAARRPGPPGASPSTTLEPFGNALLTPGRARHGTGSYVPGAWAVVGTPSRSMSSATPEPALLDSTERSRCAHPRSR